MRTRFACLFLIWLAACSESETSPADPVGSTAGEPSGSTAADDPIDDDGEPLRADLGVQPPTACEAACEAAEACQGTVASDCLLQCTTELDGAQAVSESCGASTEALQTCLGTLSCDALNQHDAGGDSPCRSLEQDVSVACGSPTGEPTSACEDVCALVDSCGISSPSECLAGCVQLQAAAEEVSPACASAQDQQLACAVDLDCAALETWMTTGDVQACPNPEDACSGE